MRTKEQMMLYPGMVSDETIKRIIKDLEARAIALHERATAGTVHRVVWDNAEEQVLEARRIQLVQKGLVR